MRRLTRYVLFELVAVFLVTLTGMTLVMMLVGLGQEAVRQGLGWEPILRLMPYVLPDALRFAVPATILFAVCSVYGRISGSGEMTAIKSLGISPMSIVWPGIALAFTLSLVAVWLNDVAVTWGRRGVQRVVVQSVEQIAYGMLRSSRSYDTARFSINVKGVEGRKLLRPVLVFHAQGDSPAVTLTAREAQLRRSPEEDALIISLTEGRIEVGNQGTMVFPDTIERVVPLSDASRKGDATGSPSHCPLRQISGRTEKQKQHIRLLEQSLAAEAAYQMLGGEFDALTDGQWDSRRRELENSRQQLFRLRVEPWRRWANGFSCLFFVMVGIPLAIRRRSADFLSSFFVCFLPILVVYYPLLAFGVDRAKCGAFPPYAVWLGNLLLLAWGALLLRRVLRY